MRRYARDDSVTEDNQSQQAMARIHAGIDARSSPAAGQASSSGAAGRRPHLRWLNGRGLQVRYRFGSLNFDITCRNDELLGISTYGQQKEGMVLGIELKKKLSWQVRLFPRA